MSKKYIKQVNSYNFVYPNNTVAEYDNEIIHDINDNSVTGQVSGFTITSASYSALTISFNYQYQLNGAEPYINTNGQQAIFSVHLMAAGQEYFKPWRLVGNVTATPTYTGTTGYTSYTLTGITASQMGLYGFENGTYTAEIRFIGHRGIYPVCVNAVVSSITPPPTPSPTPTKTPVQVTPTPTLTMTPTPSATPGLPVPSPTPSPTGSTYNYYTAEEYQCAFPGCTLTNPSILVKIVSTAPFLTTGYFYPDYYATGKVYKILGAYGGPGLAIQLTLPGSDSCNVACQL